MIWRLIPSSVVKAIGYLSYPKKFLLTVITVIVPFIVGMIMIYNHFDSQIAESRNSRQTVYRLNDVVNLLQYVQYHRGYNQSYLRGYDEFQSEIDHSQQEIEKLIKQIEEKMVAENEIIQLSWDQLKSDWLVVKKQENPRLSLAQHNHLTTNILKLIVSIIEENEVYLDSIAIQRLNSIIHEDLLLGLERLGNLRAISSSWTMGYEFTEEEGGELQTFVEAIHSLWDIIGIKYSYIKNDSIEGEERLVEKWDKLTAEKHYFINTYIEGFQGLESPATIFEEATTAIDSGFEYYEEANTVIQRYLKQQESTYLFYKWLVFSTSALIAILLFILFGGMYVSTIQKIQLLKEKALQWMQGDYSTRVEMNTNDELRQIGEVFNRLVADIEVKFEENNQLATAINALEIGVIITDPTKPNNPIIYVNSGFEKLTGYPAEEVMGKNCNILQGEGSQVSSIQKIRDGIKSCTPFSVEILNYRKNGEVFWNLLNITPIYRGGRLVNFLGLQTDITKQKKADEDIYRLAYYDQLTNLPNHNLLEELLESASLVGKKSGILARLDVARFKFLNHGRGFEVGNATLIEVARRLVEALGEKGSVYRQTGDQFTIYVPHIAQTEVVDSVINLVQQQFEKPFLIKDFTFYLRLNIGVRRFKEEEVSGSVLLQQAEEAMFEAKNVEDELYVDYQKELHHRYEEEHELENHLRTALKNNEFQLYYQPKLELKTNKIVGVEALIRWNHPRLGMVPPFKFISLAEKTGIISEIGNWVLCEACKQNKKWQEQGLEPVIVSVNISAKQFVSGQLLQNIDDALASSMLEPKWLELELTESILQNLELVKPVLNQIKQQNIQISIDDFGTGYSSLGYLKDLPVDVLKIDQVFVRNLSVDNEVYQLMKSMIDLGHGLGLGVIVEGIETEEDLMIVKQLGGDGIQGYYVSKPLPANEIEEFITNFDLRNK